MPLIMPTDYVRHRPRMVRQSVYEDLKIHLEEMNWIGSTPLNILAVDGVVSPLTLRDYFPTNAEFQGEEIPPNTLAIDQGTPGPARLHEMGGPLRSQLYYFNFALFAHSDAVALSLFSDLNDRYMGITHAEIITLWDYLQATPTPVVDMEVETFEVMKSPEQPAPGKQLYFAELVITDYINGVER